MPNELILAVDDEAHILELLSFNLEAAGYRVVTAATGEDALVVCAHERPAMVLLDIMLPGIDGMEVCRRLKGNTSTADIPIIMLTAKGDEVDKVLGLELGADDCRYSDHHADRQGRRGGQDSGPGAGRR